MVLFCVCFEGVVLPLSPELSKEMVILMKYQQLTHSKNGQVLKIKKKSIITIFFSFLLGGAMSFIENKTKTKQGKHIS